MAFCGCRKASKRCVKLGVGEGEGMGFTSRVQPLNLDPFEGSKESLAGSFPPARQGAT